MHTKKKLDDVGGPASNKRLISDAMKTLRAAGMFVGPSAPKKAKKAKKAKKKGSTGRLLGPV